MNAREKISELQDRREELLAELQSLRNSQATEARQLELSKQLTKVLETLTASYKLLEIDERLSIGSVMFRKTGKLSDGLQTGKSCVVRGIADDGQVTVGDYYYGNGREITFDVPASDLLTYSEWEALKGELSHYETGQRVYWENKRGQCEGVYQSRKCSRLATVKLLSYGGTPTTGEILVEYKKLSATPQ